MEDFQRSCWPLVVVACFQEDGKAARAALLSSSHLREALWRALEDLLIQLSKPSSTRVCCLQ